MRKDLTETNRALSSLESVLAKQVVSAAQRLQAELDLNYVAALLSHGDVNGIMRLIPLTHVQDAFATTQGTVAKAVVRGGHIGIRKLKRVLL